jgi:hypothetical protein
MDHFQSAKSYISRCFAIAGSAGNDIARVWRRSDSGGGPLQKAGSHGKDLRQASYFFVCGLLKFAGQKVSFCAGTV